MSKWLPAAAMVFVLGGAAPVPAHECEHERGGGGAWYRGQSDEYWDGPCEVKIESKRGEFKREVKCKDGVGATWRGEYKKEYQDGPCRVKLDVKRDEYKEEVKCD